LIDNLPVATRVADPDTGEVRFEHGYKLGIAVDEKSFINNHLKLKLLYHTENKYKT
jgi:hypothetical protein